MKVRPIRRRRDWQAHIQANAYQSEVLSDPEQEYWVEALPQPFAIQFTTQDEIAIATATESLWEMCVEFLDWFFTDQSIGDVHRRLELLKIPQAYWTAIRASWERTAPIEDLSLYCRFDLAVTEDGQIKLLEINGETPLLGAETVYQWNWLVDYLDHHNESDYPLPKDTSQFNEFWERVAEQWRKIADAYNLREAGISFLVDENLSEDLEMAMQLIQIIHDDVDPDIHAQVVYLRSLQDDWGTELQRGIGLDQEGYFIDQLNDRIPVLWKIYDWNDLQNDMANDGTTEVLARQLEQGQVKILEPLWKQVLANKGAMALIWQQFQDSPYRQYLLGTYLESNLDTQVAATQLAHGIHVKKPLVGQEGVGISIQVGEEDLDRRDDLGYGGEGFVVQEYIELPQSLGYHYVVGSWVVDGEAAGVIIRGDRSKITGRHCLIIPHLVSDYD